MIIRENSNLFLTFFLCAGIAFGAIGINAAATNLSPERLIGRLLLPVSEGDIERNTADASVGTTETEAVTANIASGYRNKNSVQVVTITNKHASQNICFFNVDFSDGDNNCATTCAAETVTCDGTAATDGSYVLPGTQRTFTLYGDQCPCVVGSAATTTFSADRIYR